MELREQILEATIKVFNKKGIKFKTWLYFLMFSVLMLFLLGFLLIVLIKPYYRENRIQAINNIVDTIEKQLIDKKANQCS